MDKFNLKEYLKNNPLLKEEVMVNPIIMFGGKEYIKNVITSPDDYGYFDEDAEWIKSNILTAPKMVSIQDYMGLDDEWIKQAQIDVGTGGDMDHIVDGLNFHVEKGLITPEQKAEAMEVVGLAENKTLKENDDYKIKLLVPTVYYDVDSGELYAGKNTYYTDAELEDGADQTSYTSGEELDDIVFSNDYDQAKEFEEEYPGLFKVI